MLFRPNFCANCGTKIERPEWRIWTSRRFCQVCETQFKGQDLIPRVVVVLGVLTGLVGLGSYFEGPKPERQPLPEQAKRFVAAPENRPAAPVANTAAAGNVPVNAVDVRGVDRSNSKINPANTTEMPAAPDEGKYYCGAETKKGTPCSRKVKGNVRCYQHEGMPAMLPANKLRIS